jgi:DNA-binding MarR family transcriptional regulator
MWECQSWIVVICLARQDVVAYTTTMKAKRDLFELSMDMKDHCVVYRWRMLSRLITTIYEEALRPLDLTTSQLNILAIVAGMGEAGPRHIAHFMQMEKSTVSRALGPLLRRGLLEAHQEPDDARSFRVRLSHEGESVFRRAHPLWREAQKKACAVLGRTAEELDEFVGAALQKSDLPGLGPIPVVPAEAFRQYDADDA